MTMYAPDGDPEITDPIESDEEADAEYHGTVYDQDTEKTVNPNQGTLELEW